MRHRVYFLLGILTGAIGVYLLVQQSLAEVARSRRSDAAAKEIFDSYAEQRAAREARLTPQQKIRREVMKQELRMEALEELDEWKRTKKDKEDEEKKNNAKD